jgi:hypothetical protein
MAAGEIQSVEQPSRAVPLEARQPKSLSFIVLPGPHLLHHPVLGGGRRLSPSLSPRILLYTDVLDIT